jgi:alanine racemase
VRPSVIEVDLAAISHNVMVFASLVEPARLCVVVKADAYGHGDVPVAVAAADAGADRLAVALVSEGIGLREAGVELPILVLSEPAPTDAALPSSRWRRRAGASISRWTPACTGSALRSRRLPTWRVG